jgi:pimeloyl-ACP methyl ester carboxylesterase
MSPPSSFRAISIRIAAGLLIFLVVVAGMIAFGGPKTPPLQRQLAADDVKIGSGLADLPPPLSFKARDGASLAYRDYPGVPGGGAAVLIHGSSGSSVAVHSLAKALSASGVTVFAVDVRGHGGSGPHGDIAYLGQLDDDMADVAAFVDRALPAERRLLIGHSSGGGFALRIAGGPVACRYDGFIALSPNLNHASPTNRPDAGWAGPGLARIIGLSIANRLGVHAFDGLPVLRFALESNSPNRTAAYSWRLMRNFGLDLTGWEPTVRAISRPTRVIIGSKDELFYADQYPATFAALQPKIAVHVIPGIDHMGMVIDPAAMADTVLEVHQMLSAPAPAPARCA